METERGRRGSVSLCRSNDGFGLLEVVIASAVGIVILLGLGQGIIFSSRASRSVAQNSDFNSLTALVNMVLSNTTKCPAAWKDGKGVALSVNWNLVTALNPQINVPRLDLAGGGTIAEVGKTQQGLQINAMTLSNPVLMSGNSILWTFTLNAFKVDGSGGTAVGGSTLVYTYPVIITTNGGTPDWLVTACGNSSGSGSIQEFTTSGIFTVPPGVTLVELTLVGAGGGGGTGGFNDTGIAMCPSNTPCGNLITNFGGNGGSSGQVVNQLVRQLVPGTSIPVILGTGGVAASCNPQFATGQGAQGGSGGTTYFGPIAAPLASAPGGSSGSGFIFLGAFASPLCPWSPPNLFPPFDTPGSNTFGAGGGAGYVYRFSPPPTGVASPILCAAAPGGGDQPGIAGSAFSSNAYADGGPDGGAGGGGSGNVYGRGGNGGNVILGDVTPGTNGKFGGGGGGGATNSVAGACSPGGHGGDGYMIVRY